MTSPNLAQFMMPPGEPDVGFHTGEVVTWDSDLGTNSVRLLGRVFDNLPVLTSAGQVSLEAGTVVGVLSYKTSLFVLGRIVVPGSGLAQPQQPIVMYPQFGPVGPATGASGYHTLDAGVLGHWEGRARPTQPYIEVDGIWGIASGAGSVTYAVKVNGVTAGTQTFTSGISVSRLGPYDVRAHIGGNWLRVDVAITASSGTGERAFGVLGAYFRQQ